MQYEPSSQPTTGTDFLTPEQSERRSGQEPILQDQGLVENYPKLKPLPIGTERAKGAIRRIVELFSNRDVQEVLFDKKVRHHTTYDQGRMEMGHLILAPVQSSVEPKVQDGRFYLESYLNAKETQLIEQEVKDTLFAIRREASRHGNAGKPIMDELRDLAFLGIYNIQEQSRNK